MTRKTSIRLGVVLLVLLLAIAGVMWRVRQPDTSAPPATVRATPPPPVKPSPARSPAMALPAMQDPLAGQGRATIEASDAAGGRILGRVVNWATGDGVTGAELTFTSDGGATTVHSRDDGAFELAPSAPGRFVLSAIAAPGFLPYAPELLHSTVHVTLLPHQTVRGLTVFLFPAIDYRGTVVDSHGAPVAGARIRLLGTPEGEQMIDRLETEWTSDHDGHFTFHAADGAVLEAVLGERRGWARLTSDVTMTRQLTITIDREIARNLTISGRVIDGNGAPLADVLIRAAPSQVFGNRATAFATTGADGAFVLDDLDGHPYDLTTQADGFAPTTIEDVPGGRHDLVITLDSGLVLAGRVVDGDAHPVPAYTLLVHRRIGMIRDLVVARSIIDPRGEFSLQVAKGDYELIASAPGWAPSPPTHAAAGTRDLQLVLGQGATLRGKVIASDDGAPIGNARVQREAVSGGASAQPANAGTVTHGDGTFELTGIPAGPLSITIGAADFNAKIEAGMTASDGGTIGPITIALDRLRPGEAPTVELVGIGVVLSAGDDALVIQRVIAGGGAEAAGIVVGDQLVSIDGQPVLPLGIDGTIAKIRGVEGTTLVATLRRDGKLVPVVVQRRKLKA